MSKLNTPTNILNTNQFVAHIIRLSKKECKSEIIPRVRKKSVEKVLGIDIID